MSSPTHLPAVIVQADELEPFDDTLPDEALLVPVTREQELFVLYTELRLEREPVRQVRAAAA